MKKQKFSITELSGFEQLTIQEQQMLKGGSWWSVVSDWVGSAIGGIIESVFGGGGSQTATFNGGNGNVNIQQNADGNVYINGQKIKSGGSMTPYGADSIKALGNGGYIIYGSDSTKIVF